MPKMDADVLEKYEALMRKDPFSKAFAPLANAYLENQQADRAEAIVRDGLKKHPEFAAGLIVYAKILKFRGQHLAALELLKKASRVAPDNVLAYQLMGDVHLEMKNSQEALKAYKMVLFFNPMAQKAKKIIQKLESLSALDFEDQTFSLAKLTNIEQMKRATPIEYAPLEKAVALEEATPAELSQSQQKAMQRMLSLIDAFIVRNDLVKASELIDECKQEYGSDPELLKRANLVRTRGFSSQLAQQNAEEATPLAPIESREKQILQKKLEKLQLLLRKIDDLRV